LKSQVILLKTIIFSVGECWQVAIPVLGIFVT